VVSPEPDVGKVQDGQQGESPLNAVDNDGLASLSCKLWRQFFPRRHVDAMRLTELVGHGTDQQKVDQRPDVVGIVRGSDLEQKLINHCSSCNTAQYIHKSP
jgi:hypothetical protein